MIPHLNEDSLWYNEIDVPEMLEINDGVAWHCLYDIISNTLPGDFENDTFENGGTHKMRPKIQM